MDDNFNNKHTTYEVVNLKDEKKTKKSSFSNNVIVPFISGVLGATLVVGVCFGVPEIKQNIIGSAPTSNTNSNTRK